MAVRLFAAVEFGQQCAKVHDGVYGLSVLGSWRSGGYCAAADCFRVATQAMHPARSVRPSCIAG